MVEDYRLDMKLLNKNELNGTWYIEMKPFKEANVSNNMHWDEMSKFLIPEYLELFTTEIKKVKKKFSFFCMNKFDINEEKKLVKGLIELKLQLKDYELNDFKEWLYNNEFSENLIKIFNTKQIVFDKEIQGGFIAFLEEIIMFIENCINNNDGLLIIGV